MADEFEAWVGRVEEATDTIFPQQVRRMALTLDQPCDSTEGAVLPPLWHWMGWAPEAPMASLGPDGHPARGGFLPPVPLERRMWAGGRLTFHRPLRVGVALRRRSEILKVAEKTGSAGRMVFVTVRHEVSMPEGLAVTEEQDIVYIAMPDRFSPPPPVAAPERPVWEEAIAMDTVRLFRFSAMTFNAHRIHYDLDYAQRVEKYPALVVHGPMQAMLLMAAARRHRRETMPASYRYRGVRPLFHTDRPRLLGEAEAGGQQAVCTATGEGLVCMQAEVGWNGGAA
jgi:3-methylfumaryl-CoA hydratase